MMICELTGLPAVVNVPGPCSACPHCLGCMTHKVYFYRRDDGRAGRDLDLASHEGTTSPPLRDAQGGAGR